jgi:hypothetical protein
MTGDSAISLSSYDNLKFSIVTSFYAPSRSSALITHAELGSNVPG